MARLYLANPTNQTHRYYYRLDVDRQGSFIDDPRRKSAQFLQVESGHQGTINLDHVKQFQTIMDQLALIGGMGAEELNRLPPQLVPVVMSCDKVVKEDAIRRVHDHNKGILKRQGDKLRATAAIAANELVKQSVEATLQKFTVEFEQIPDAETDRERDGKHLEAGIEVGPRPGQDPPRQNRRQRGRAGLGG